MYSKDPISFVSFRSACMAAHMFVSLLLCSHAAEIHEAVIKGDVALIEKIIKKDKRQVHSTDYTAQGTPLALAIIKGHPDCVNVLFKHGADVNETSDEYGATPLMLAASVMDDDMSMATDVLEGIRKFQLSPEGELKEKMRPEVDAIMKDVGKEVLKVMSDWPLDAPPERMDILQQILVKKPDFKRMDKQGWTVMHHAARLSPDNIFQLLLSHGGEVDVRSKDWLSPLHLAVENVNLKAAKVLLKAGADIERESRDGRTALHYAAANGSLPMVTLLLAHSAQADREDLKGVTPLHLAAQSGKCEVASLLLKNGSRINALDSGRMTPLHYACSHGRLDMVTLLLQEGAKLEAADREGFTPILYAAECAQMKVVELLLAKGADPKLLTGDGRTILHLICSNHPSPDWIDRMVAAGVRVDQVDVNTLTALHHASQWGRRDAVQYLLKNGANPNALTSNGNSPLMFASLFGEPITAAMGGTKGSREDYIAVCEMLMRSGAHLGSVPKNGWTMIHSSARTGNLELLKQSIESGLDVNAKDHTGRTALHFAVDTGIVAIVKVLLENGADANSVDAEGDHPMLIAARTDSGELIKLLHKHGASLKVHDRKYKATPLHYAAYDHKTNAMRALLALGADVAARDFEGNTPLHRAADVFGSTIEEVRNFGPATRDFFDKMVTSKDSNETARKFQNSLKYSQFEEEMQFNKPIEVSDGSKARCLEAVKLLLEYKASPKSKNDAGLTAIDIAMKIGTPEVVNLLKSPPMTKRKDR